MFANRLYAGNIQGIRYSVAEPLVPASVKATVFLYHGWSSCKENYHFMGSIMSLAGYQVIMPDAPGHGSRGTMAYEDEEVMEKEFWGTVMQTVDEHEFLRKEMERKGLLGSGNLAVMGSSMGGIISGSLFARNPDLFTAVIMNGACDWADADARVKESRGIQRQTVDLDRRKKYDPSLQLEAIYPRPFLLLHGEEDTAVPITTQDHFYERASDYYGEEKERIRYTRIRNLNHHKTVGMLEESINWMNYLLERMS